MTPISNAKIGVQLLSIPAYPDEMPVSAYVNKNDGMKFPQVPTMVSKINCLQLLSFLAALIANGRSDKAAIVILSPATCESENIGWPLLVNIPFFIRMKELPHMQARTMSVIQLFD